MKDREEKKNLIRIHFRLTNLVRRVTHRVDGDVREFGGGGGGGGGFSFRDADVVPFTFEVD